MRQSSLLQNGTPDLRPAVPRLEPRPPQWLVSAMPSPSHAPGSGSIRIATSGMLSLLSVVIPDAAAMDVAALDAAVAGAYVDLGRSLDTIERHAIRLWNYLPDPGHLMAAGLDRYMVFNGGRHRGYGQWSTRLTASDETLPTASAVGVDERALTIHCLASELPGRAVENPRQTPAWRYSARYGPTPPSFSRATLARIDGRTRLLIAGTASIVGEDSTHVGNLDGQLAETFTNLASLIGSATGVNERPSDALHRLSELRIYAVRPEDGDAIRAAVRARCAPQLRVDLVQARLCRPELLVEIEGVASVPAGRH